MSQRHIKIIKRGWLKQKWYAQFIADNGLILSITEHYHNYGDLKEMLATYFSNWPIEETV